MTTEQTTENQEPLTAAEQGDGVEVQVAETQTAASGKPGKPGETGEAGGDGKGADEVLTLKDDLKTSHATITRMRDEFSQSHLQQQIDRFESATRSADITDAKSVDDGTMTATAATTKSHERRDAMNTQIEAEQDRAYQSVASAQEQVELRTVRRLGSAQDLGRELKLTLEDVNTLNLDTSIKDEPQMRFAAEKLQFAAEKANATGSDKFDSGQRGAVSVNVDDMSGFEMVREGLARQK